MYHVISQDPGPFEIPARHILGSNVFRNLKIFWNSNYQKRNAFAYSKIENRNLRISYPGTIGLPKSRDIISWDPGSSEILGYHILGSWSLRDPGISHPRIRERSRSVWRRLSGDSAGVEKYEPAGHWGRCGQGACAQDGKGWGAGQATAWQIRAGADVRLAWRQTAVPSNWPTGGQPGHHHPNSGSNTSWFSTFAPSCSN